MPLPLQMSAIAISAFGPPEMLVPVSRPVPLPRAGEVLIRVEAAGLNRGDIMQRQGFYPPPPGITDIPGLEVAGRVAATGDGVTEWQVDDRVCAILAGGGYAEYAVAPQEQCLALPDTLSMIEGAALPETMFTCWTNLVDDGRLTAGNVLLIHGGASGIGTTGIQLAKALGATVFVTAGTEGKCAACLALGADMAINYHQQDFVAQSLQATQGRGVDVVLDMVGGDYVGRSMDVLAAGGRYVVIGVMKTQEAMISLGALIGKRLTLTGSTLRARDSAEKGRIRDAVRNRIWSRVTARGVVAVVHHSFPMNQAAAAHRMLEAGSHIGKIVLTTQYLTD